MADVFRDIFGAATDPAAEGFSGEFALDTVPQIPDFDTSSELGVIDAEFTVLGEDTNALEEPEPFRTEDPMVLKGEDRRIFESRFKRALDNARRRMTEIHEQARRDREIYKMLAREPNYPGGPDVTTPLSANKVDGTIAHLREAIEQRPMGSFSVEGAGKQAVEAKLVAPICEAYLERELNRSGSREALSGDMVKEATKVGSAIARLTMAEYPNEPFAQISNVIRLENFFVDRINVDHLRDTFCAYEEKRRYYELEQEAENGILDKESVEKIKTGVGQTEAFTLEEELMNFEESSLEDPDVAIKDIVVGWMRFKPQGSRRTILYECVWHDATMTALAIRLNSVRRAFDAPALALHRIGKSPGSLFGTGITARLRSEQVMADNSVNNHLALNNLAASPPYLYRQSSPFGQAVARHGGINGLWPGMAIGTHNSPNIDDVKTLEFRNPGLSLQDVELAFQFADKATFTEEAIGSSTATDPRKTLGQFQIEVQKGAIRLKLDLADYAFDAAQTLQMYWAMMIAYKIEPAGIVEVQEGGKFLAARDIEKEELEQTIAEILIPLAQAGEVTPEEMAELEVMLTDRTVQDFIPSAKRRDLTISLTGTKIIADKIGELQMLFQLSQFISDWLGPSHQDKYANYHLRSIMQAMGFKDIDKRMPDEPEQILDPAAREIAMQPARETMQRSVVL